MLLSFTVLQHFHFHEAICSLSSLSATRRVGNMNRDWQVLSICVVFAEPYFNPDLIEKDGNRVIPLGQKVEQYSRCPLTYDEYTHVR